MVEYLFYEDINFWSFYLIFLIPYLSFTISVLLGKIRLKRGFNRNWLFVVDLFIGALIGFITYPIETITERLISGGFFYGFLLISVPRAIIEQEILPRIIELRISGTLIKKLKINNDYLDVLKDANIFTLEDLIRINIRDLCDETGLSMETIIRFRERAKKILKKKKK